MSRIISVVSGKGGVGKTTLVSNLGVLLAQEGKRVVVVDGNLTGANLGFHFGLLSYPSSIHEVMKGEAEVEDALHQHSSGVEIIPASLSSENIHLEPVNIREALLKSLGDKDFILIDCATGLDRETINAIDMCDEAILVTHPELPTISDALRAKTLLEMYGKKIHGVVLNRVTKRDEMKRDNVASFLELPILSVIHEHSSVRKCVEENIPISLKYPDHRVSQEFRRVSHYLLKKEFIPKEGIWDRILSYSKDRLIPRIQEWKPKHLNQLRIWKK